MRWKQSIVGEAAGADTFLEDVLNGGAGGKRKRARGGTREVQGRTQGITV